jgi:dipeptidyl aminopeptidase/acylaminoacyl peptidase
MTRKAIVACSLAAALPLSLATVALAQREPVLKQIKVPHHYYYREMYLPQATSGPNAVAWAPGGREVAVSMQGSLWRIDLASGVARQLTNGPGYDYQPDWSPDGKSIAYSSYRDDAMELRLLDLATNETRTLMANGAVNVDPRWSPDSRRIAFVSTVHSQRWHIHVLDIADGVPGKLVRLTEDNDSKLPRYYYSVYDHYLSPTWSPDGGEILFVSNRGHIWGSGGFWRMKAESGAPAREIRYEETTWRARPDWARDGKRVVYSSYLGRQWNQLWLMTSEGGDPFPISYGDYDATAPRWSPDGRQIAYVSNQDGNPSLWIQDIPGGSRRRVEIRAREPFGPVGTLKVEIVDAETGAPLPARVSVTTPDGRSHVPDDAWRHADDGFDRSERKVEYGYFHVLGKAEIRVPAGPVSIEVVKGFEYRIARSEVSVADSGVETVRIALERLDDLPAKGWWSGDVHVHMNYGGAYRNTPAHLVFQAQAEDVHVVENLIVNKEQRIPDVAYFTGTLDPDSTKETLVFHSQEFHTSFWGHTGILGPTKNVLIPDYAAYVNTAAASLSPHNAVVSDLARSQQALFGYVHPFDEEPDPKKADVPLTHELPVDVALGKVDYYEVVGFSDHLATANVWYRLLNCGFRLPAAAGTDAMANFASLRGPVGMNRVFVKIDGALDHGRWLAGLKAGRTFVTNSPLLSFTLGGKEIGEEIALPAGSHELEARLELRSVVPVDHLEIVSNGRVVTSVPLSEGGTAAKAIRKLKLDRSGWYTLRAYADRSRHPVLDVYPFATTSPIYVTVGKTPVRSTADAEYFLAWIARLESAARAHSGWNTDDEKATVLASLAEARAVYRDRAGSARPR